MAEREVVEGQIQPEWKPRKVPLGIRVPALPKCSKGAQRLEDSRADSCNGEHTDISLRVSDRLLAAISGRGKNPMAGTLLREDRYALASSSCNGEEV